MVESVQVCPCGIYPEICPIYIADKGGHTKLKEVLAGVFNVTADAIACDGCLSETPFVHCQECTIRSCVIEKGVEGCNRCDDFPCTNVESMDDNTKKVVLRAVPVWKELGTEKFIEEEMKHYQCPNCGNQLFMGAQKCRNCGNEVALD